MTADDEQRAAQRREWKRALASVAAVQRNARRRPAEPAIRAGMLRKGSPWNPPVYSGYMSELSVEDTPGVADAAHEAARGEVVYITEHGQRLAAIVPAEYAEDLADAAAVRAARVSIDAGEPLIPWEQIKAEAGL